MEDIVAALELVKVAEGHMHETGDGEFEYNEVLDEAYGHLRDARVILQRFLNGVS
jgi:hypothetical protein